MLMYNSIAGIDFILFLLLIISVDAVTAILLSTCGECYLHSKSFFPKKQQVCYYSTWSKISRNAFLVSSPETTVSLTW